jgi:hypothetical protein
MANGLDECAVNVTIPLNQTKPWMATGIGIELDDTVDQMAQVTLASLCGSLLADTTVMPIVHFLIYYQGDPMWKKRLEAISNPDGPHFLAGMAAMAEYVQYSFNLWHTLELGCL